MILRVWCFDQFHAMALLWNECREDPVIFCYRISQGAFVLARKRTTASAHVALRPPRTKPDCSISSESFSTGSMTSKG